MKHKSSHEKSASAKLTFVVLSDAEKPSRTVSLTKVQLTSILVLCFVVIGAVSILAMIETPVGKWVLPNYFTTQAEQLEKVRDLEAKVDTVQEQLTYLASYNVRLRNILGDTGAVESAIMNSENGNGSVAGAKTEAPPQMIVRSTVQNQQASAPVVNPLVSARDGAEYILPLLMPVSGFISRDVNYTIQHYGVDISATKGEPIVAPAPGEVIFSDWTVTGGNTLIIAHPGDIITVYKHCERILAQVGTRVTRGEAIAIVGSTGVTSTGSHLHFELWQDGKNLDPTNYLLTRN